MENITYIRFIPPSAEHITMSFYAVPVVLAIVLLLLLGMCCRTECIVRRMYELSITQRTVEMPCDDVEMTVYKTTVERGAQSVESLALPPAPV